MVASMHGVFGVVKRYVKLYSFFFPHFTTVLFTSYFLLNLYLYDSLRFYIYKQYGTKSTPSNPAQ